MTTSVREVELILSLSKQGLSNREIAARVLGRRTAESTVRGILSAYSNEQSELQDMTRVPLNEVQKYNKPPCLGDVDNSRVLIISDTHFPYHHPDTLEFLLYLSEKYNPTRVIHVGDELDKHALSYHDSDPDLPSAGDELRESLKYVKELHEMFPEMDILESNHGSLVWRKAKTHGIPRHYIKSYRDVLQVDDGWTWHFDLTITLPDGKRCYFHHGKSSDVLKLSQQMGMCAVQGHYHERFKVEYWGNPTGLYWGLQVGCLIDDSSYAFSYNNVNIKRPVIGTALIIDSQPVLEPMVLGKDGRWVWRNGVWQGQYRKGS